MTLSVIFAFLGRSGPRDHGKRKGSRNVTMMDGFGSFPFGGSSVFQNSFGFHDGFSDGCASSSNRLVSLPL